MTAINAVRVEWSKTVESTPIEPAAMSRKDAAKYLGIGERTLWSLSASGEIPCCKIRARVLYRRCDLDEYLKTLAFQHRR